MIIDEMFVAVWAAYTIGNAFVVWMTNVWFFFSSICLLWGVGVASLFIFFFPHPTFPAICLFLFYT